MIAARISTRDHKIDAEPFTCMVVEDLRDGWYDHEIRISDWSDRKVAEWKERNARYQQSLVVPQFLRRLLARWMPPHPGPRAFVHVRRPVVDHLRIDGEGVSVTDGQVGVGA